MDTDIETIKEFIESDKVNMKISRKPLNEYVEIFEKLGMKEYDFENNGYQVDFWIYFYQNKTRYCIHGDLWYQKVWNIGKEEIKE